MENLKKNEFVVLCSLIVMIFSTVSVCFGSIENVENKALEKTDSKISQIESNTASKNVQNSKKNLEQIDKKQPQDEKHLKKSNPKDQKVINNQSANNTNDYDPKKVDPEVIKRFVNYLSTLDSFLVKFEQYTKKTHASGVLLIKKPNNMRCNYDNSYPLLITSNKSQTSVYDYEMDQLSSINPQDAPFSFLLSKNVSIDKNFDIITAMLGPKGDLISLRHKDTESMIHIIISKATRHLERLIIKQPGSEEVDVQFGEFVPIKWFDEKLFTIRNPKVFGKPIKLTEEELKKFYKK